jgi:maleylacetoacetate isomerase|tara:strand:+ start:36281 stop:36916 length:636 start_codon:yes stop_codon:yes gene_type:complete
MKLYDYYRSTASYRVRIALNLKQLTYETIPVHLVNHGGEQHTADYKKINPQGLVPALDLETNTQPITQSLAILEYLEEEHPNPPLLPKDAYARTQIRSLALLIATDIHPLNNLRVLKQLRTQFNASDDDVKSWYHHWLQLGFDAFEEKLKHLPRDGTFCYGKHISMADICLIPQVYNAQRFEFSLVNYPLIQKIADACLNIKAFEDAAPSR